MTDQTRSEESLPGDLKDPTSAAPTPNSPPEMEAIHSSAVPPTDPSKLSIDEQMALYEKDLKENDWGHQPC